MPLIIATFVATVLPTFIVLWWISANPKSVEVVGQSIGTAFGQVGKGVGEGVITPLLEYTFLGGLAALALALIYKVTGAAVGGGLPAPPAPPGFAPPPQFGSSVGISAGPVSGVVGTVPAPVSPGLQGELSRRQQRPASRSLRRR